MSAAGVSAMLAELTADGRTGTVFHIGSGYGVRPADLLALPVRRIVLVEADPDLAKALRRQLTDPRVTVIAAAVARAQGQGRLNRFNLSRLASLAEPSEALSPLFPGLRRTGSVDVQTQALADLTGQFPPEPDDADLLIVESPGAEELIVRQLLALPDAGAESGQPGPGTPAPGRFRHLVLRAGAEAFYQDSSHMAALTARLAAAGYRQLGRDDSDAEFPLVWMQLDPLQIRIRQLEAERHAQEGQLEQARAEQASVLREIAALRSVAEAAKTGLAAERDRALAEAGELRAGLKAAEEARAAQEGQLEQARAERASVLKEIAALRSGAEAAKTGLAAERDRALAEAGELRAGLKAAEEARAEQAGLRGRLTEAEARNALLESRLGRAESSLAAAGAQSELVMQLLRKVRKGA